MTEQKQQKKHLKRKSPQEESEEVVVESNKKVHKMPAFCTVVVPAVVPLLQHMHRDEHVEVEARLGRYNEHSRTFDTGVLDQYFNSLLETVRAAMEIAPNDWDSTNLWHTSTELYYADNLRRIMAGQYDPVYAPGAVRESTWQKKKTLLDHTVQVGNRHYDVRFAAKLEAPIVVAPPIEVTSRGTVHVRIKHRLSFVNQRAGFRLDFTQVYAAATEALALALAFPTTYEVEIELLRAESIKHAPETGALIMVQNAFRLLNLTADIDVSNVVDTRRKNTR